MNQSGILQGYYNWTHVIVNRLITYKMVPKINRLDYAISKQQGQM